MDDDEDDLYGTAEAEQNGANQNQQASVTHNTQTANDEEEDSDDVCAEQSKEPFNGLTWPGRSIHIRETRDREV